MCGIAGMVNWPDSSESLGAMNGIQLHRGPDDEGVWLASPESGSCTGLASRRLAIIDLSPDGHMPMANAEESVWITYNGEVYNFRALRAELEAKGHKFRSGTDTEVVLRLYEELGPACVRRLNGMFAFAIWDARHRRLFLARDHFGIKPLYYVQRGGGLAFASEIKALLTMPGLRAELDLRALHQYLTFLWVPDPMTSFRGVWKLPAGHYALFEDGELRVSRYWDLTYPEAGKTYTHDEVELVEAVRDRLRRSVEQQMVSDVPIGAFLSGGLDSSSIVAMMAGASTEPVSTYTIAFTGKNRASGYMLDDPQLAQEVANRFGCRHTEILVDPDVAALLPKVVWHLDEPIADPAAIMAYLVSAAARPTTTVLLSGIGGDELFAGYRKYRAHYLAQHYRRLPGILRRHLIEPAIDRFPPLTGARVAPTIRLLRKMARSGSLPPRERFIMDSVYLDATQKASLYTPQLRAATADLDARQTHLSHFDRVTGADFLHQMAYVDAKTFMVSLNLTYNDKMSMASSVEVRVPFLDWELAEFVANEVPPQLKLRRGTTKHILRRAMEQTLPRGVLRAKKAGFGAPIDRWLSNDLQPMLSDLLSESVIRRRGLFEPAAVTRMMDEHKSGRRDWTVPLWQLLTLELWQRAFIDVPVPAAALPATRSQPIFTS
jgi:asparagine synthase (glutamine-hydrolysing)